jgi:hypothetical protein
MSYVVRARPATAYVTSRLPPSWPTRRALQLVLGMVWLLDAALQFQPYMFNSNFVTKTIEPTAAGDPGVVAGPVLWAAHVIAHHVALYNAVFATIQLVIAAGFFARRTVRPALAASMVWAVFVWWFGEGLGGILTGGSPLVGAPGAVLLYALIALLRWPAPEHDRIINGSKSRDDHGCKPLAMRFASMIDVMDVPLGPLLGTHRYIHAAEHHSPTAPIRDACTQIMKIGDP